jgi:uncharacterized membrane protein YraQ (UPF0718 family)
MGVLAFLGQWAAAFWSTLRETAPFLVFGLLLAGVLHVLVPPRVILWALGHGGWRGALRGAIVGLPLPLCSCGVVPTALTLRRQGASLSATASFTISTPETSIDAVAITAAMLPMAFLGARPIAAILLAVCVGTVVELFSVTTRDHLRMNVIKLARSENKTRDATRGDVVEICRVCGLMTDDDHGHGITARVKAIFSYAFGTFFRDIASWVVLGLVLAALLQIALPPSVLEADIFHRFPSIQVLLAIIVSVPLYSCATATTPLAAVLIGKGLNPGAALALLLAGPATNIGNVFLFRREFGARATAIYYAALFLFCWVFGTAFNMLWSVLSQFPALTETIGGGAGAEWIAHAAPAWMEVASSVLILALTAHVWARSLRRLGEHAHDSHAH